MRGREVVHQHHRRRLARCAEDGQMAMATLNADWFRACSFSFPVPGLSAGWPSIRRDAMKNFASKINRFLKSEDGPTAVEYAVMLALIVVVCLGAITSIGSRANTTFTNVANQLGG